MPKYRAHSTEFKPPCQVGGRRTHLLPSLPIARSRSGNTSDAGDITPSLKGTITGSSMAACDQKVATKLEEVVDLAVAGEKALRMSRRREALHLPFSPSRRLARDLRPVVERAALPVLDPGQDRPLGRGVALELVGGERTAAP